MPAGLGLTARPKHGGMVVEVRVRADDRLAVPLVGLFCVKVGWGDATRGLSLVGARSSAVVRVEISA